jgi:hypothetical protein
MDWLWSMKAYSKLPTCSTDKSKVPMVTFGWACMDPTELVRLLKPLPERIFPELTELQ